MAKKQKAEVAVEEPVVVAPPKKEKKPTWQFKDRQYILKNGLSPLTYTIKSRGIFWFDEEKGYEREIKYTLNQRSPFVDEFKGDARLDHITFENGVLKIDLHHGNELVAPITFECDGDKVFVESQNPHHLYRLNSNCQ